MKIFVLGSTGMLGRYVAKYLKQFYEVIELNRHILDAAELDKNTFRMILGFRYGLSRGDVVINCMGTIKPQIDAHGKVNAILVNSVFPNKLANFVEIAGAHLIHPTTDCVYSGSKGMYTEEDEWDVNDVYGMTKALGEPHNATCIRTSIIGEEYRQARSLVEWAKANAGKEVFGYTNHYWNGITCLEFAKVCKRIITSDDYWFGVRHVFSPVGVSKAILLEQLNKVYNLNLEITYKTVDKCDRMLYTNFQTCDTLEIPELFKQIIEMKEFSNILYS